MFEILMVTTGIVLLTVFILVSLTYHNKVKTSLLHQLNQCDESKSVVITKHYEQLVENKKLKKELLKKQNVIRLLRRQTRLQQKEIKKLKSSV